MAGTNAGFDATAFREAIRAAMTMGLPNTVADRATFQWTVGHTYAVHDPSGNPYDLSATPATTTTHADVQIPVAIEFTARPASERDTPIGQFDATQAILYALDEDYAQVAGADQVLLGQNVYKVSFVAPPMGLFDVDVYAIYTVARDES